MTKIGESEQTDAGAVSDQNPFMEQFSYDDKIVRMFSLATLIWGVVALLC